MTRKRKVIVHLLAMIALISLFLLPMIAFMGADTQAGATAQSAAVQSGDYVFFVVQDNNDVPLAATPKSTDVSSYVIWISLASLTMMVIFSYSAWYMNIRRILRELSFKLTPSERRTYKVSQGFLHPVRSYQLAKEAENTVASMYIGQF